MSSSGCATGSTSLGIPTTGLSRAVPGLCLSLGEGSGPNGEGQVPVQGSTRDGVVRPAFLLHLSWVGSLGHSSERGCVVCDVLGSDQECPKFTLHSISRSNYDRSPAATRHSGLPP